TKTGLSLYINYIVHGMGVLILMQNVDALSLKWSTDVAGIASVVAMLGIGRLIAILITGKLSDVLGRRLFVYLGMGIYTLFFLGILISPNLQVAMFFAVLAGIANSSLDSGTYPALMESFPEAAGTANVLIKAAVQIGQFALPFIIAIISKNNLWFGWSFIVCIGLLAVNAIFLATVPFPDAEIREGNDKDAVVEMVKLKKPAKMHVDGLAFILYGFISQATFYLISQFITLYGREVAMMSEAASSMLVSYYSIGSLVCVAITAILATRIRPVSLLIPYTFMSFISISLMYFFPTPIILTVGAAFVGFFAAGGVMQLGLTVMGEMFPQGKGTITGIFYTFGSIASFLIPVISGRIVSHNPRNVMLLDAVISGVGFLLAIMMYVRYYTIVDVEK
ncbi:MAG TPA: MFS transporter, partial [Erysipelothrix sp.]|nr:MFS transporter [Erysipelothrix sp.]